MKLFHCFRLTIQKTNVTTMISSTQQPPERRNVSAL